MIRSIASIAPPTRIQTRSISKTSHLIAAWLDPSKRHRLPIPKRDIPTSQGFIVNHDRTPSGNGTSSGFQVYDLCNAQSAKRSNRYIVFGYSGHAHHVVDRMLTGGIHWEVYYSPHFHHAARHARATTDGKVLTLGMPFDRYVSLINTTLGTESTTHEVLQNAALFLNFERHGTESRPKIPNGNDYPGLYQPLRTEIARATDILDIKSGSAPIESSLDVFFTKRILDATRPSVTNSLLFNRAPALYLRHRIGIKPIEPTS